MPSTGAAKAAQQNKRRLEKRGRIIAAYGGQCTECGEERDHVLTIEHIGGVLPHYRGKISGNRLRGENLYNLIIKENFPDYITVLCFNCNLGGRVEQLRTSA